MKKETTNDRVMLPLWDYCILDIPEDKIPKVIMPDQAKGKPLVDQMELLVLFTGPECVNIKPNDKLLFSIDAAIPFSFNGKQYFLISERACGIVFAPLRELKKKDGKRDLPSVAF